MFDIFYSNPNTKAVLMVSQKYIMKENKLEHTKYLKNTVAEFTCA